MLIRYISFAQFKLAVYAFHYLLIYLNVISYCSEYSYLPWKLF